MIPFGIHSDSVLERRLWCSGVPAVRVRDGVICWGAHASGHWFHLDATGRILGSAHDKKSLDTALILEQLTEKPVLGCSCPVALAAIRRELARGGTPGP